VIGSFYQFAGCEARNSRELQCHAGCVKVAITRIDGRRKVVAMAIAEEAAGQIQHMECI
jgi:hypothetical protein